MIRITCPCCGVGIKAEDRLMGQDVRCPKCLSPVKVQSPGKADLAKIVEPNYEPQTQEDDQPKAIDCPKCGNHLRIGEYLCKRCGYHVKLEAFFEVLTSEALAAGTEPKTKMERWLETQLHELSTPRDFMIISALCALFFCLVAVVVGRIFAGPLIGTILGLIASAGIALIWYVLMQRLGVMNDPKREERLVRERNNGLEKVVRDPGKGRVVSEQRSKPVPVGVKEKASASPEPQMLAIPEYEVDDIDLFSDAPPKRAKPTPARPVSSPSPQKETATRASSTSPAAPSTHRPAAPTKKPAPKDDDWLNDLL
ncbi:hypothetical protein [Bremerella cremea]|nr:hypothetical protein [Bremerella cremea]